MADMQPVASTSVALGEEAFRRDIPVRGQSPIRPFIVVFLGRIKSPNRHHTLSDTTMLVPQLVSLF